MPFSHVTSLVSHRVLEARGLHRTCGSPDLSDDIKKSLRGHIYVTLYGIYEATVSRCVSTAVDVANQHAIPLVSLRHGPRLFALRPTLESYRDIGPDKTWERGLLLLDEITSTRAAKLENVFPADGSFMKPSQLQLIWGLFGLPGDPWPHPRLIGRIHELVEARNDVAHGTEAPSDRGGRISDAEMKDRIDDVEALCMHIVVTFSVHLCTRSGFLE